MSVLWGILLGLLVNECCDVSPWLARRVIRWATRMRYRGQPHRLEVRLPELEGVVEEAPGKLCKLLVALWFAGSVAIRRQRPRVARFVGPDGLNVKILVTPTVIAIGLAGLTTNWVLMVLAGCGGLALSVLLVFAVANFMLGFDLPSLIEENVVSAAEADFVLALYPTRWWRLGGRRGIPRRVRLAARELKSVLIAVASERASLDHYHSLRFPFRPTAASWKGLDDLLRETAEARRRLNRVARESGGRASR